MENSNVFKKERIKDSGDLTSCRVDLWDSFWVSLKNRDKEIHPRLGVVFLWVCQSPWYSLKGEE